MIGLLLTTISFATVVPTVAILIAIATFIASQREFGRRAKVDYVAGLEKRIEDLEGENKSLDERVEACEKDRRTLRDENYRLMSRIIALEKPA